MGATGCNYATREVDQTEKDCRRRELTGERERSRRVAGRHCGDRKEVQRHEQRGNRENAPARRREFPTVFRVKTNSKKNCRDRGEDQKLQHWNLRNLGPQTDHKGSRTTDDQQAADDLAPADVALFHEGVEDFAEGTAWRTWWRRRWCWC